MSQVLTFDEKEHIYRLGDEILPSVTEVIKGAGLAGDFMPDPWYLQRGSLVHAASALLDRNDLDESSLDPAIAGYVQGYRNFLKETGFVPEVIEVPRFNPKLMFAGTPDRVGRLDGEGIVLDLKTGVSRPRWHRLQTAAYVLLSPEHPEKRAALYLAADGGYSLVEHADPNDSPTFMSFTRPQNSNGLAGWNTSRPKPASASTHGSWMPW